MIEIVTRIENRSNYAVNRNNWNDRAPGVYVELKEGATRAEAEAQLRQIDKKYVPEWYEDLVKKGQDLERIVLSRAVTWHLEHRILCYGNKTVIFD